MNESLDELLDGLRARGVLDSTGAFGVDMVRGEAKLARFQLAEPGLYLAKVLQGVAQSRPALVKIQLGAGEVRLTSVSPQLPPDPDALRDTRHLSQDLLIGLRAAAASGPHDVYWEEWNGQRGARLEFTAEGQGSVTATSQAPPGCSGPCGQFVLHRNRSFYDRLFYGPSMAAEHHAVTTRAGLYSAPLWLDGRQVNAPAVEPRGLDLRVADERVDSRYWLMRRCLVARVPALPYREMAGAVREVEGKAPCLLHCTHEDIERPGAYYQQLFGIPHEQPWFPLEASPGSLTPSWCHADLRIPVSLMGVSQVLYVKHGLTLERVPADLGCPGAQATVSVPAPTDLSQFALLRGEGLDNLHLYLQAHVRSMLRDLRWQLEGLRRAHPGIHQFLVQRLGTPQSPRSPS